MFVCQCLVSSWNYRYSMIKFLERFQNRPSIVIVCAILLMIGSCSVALQNVSADQSPQSRFKVGYNDGLKNAGCDFKQCHGHGYDRTVPTGHTNPYNNGYSKGYQDGWNKANGGSGGNSQQSINNATGNINASSANSQEVPNNNDVCDPVHQFCAMTTGIG
jgi:hypothetical protein